ncbi:MAG: deoxyribonuclease IV [Clostridia bacterium]|jgi:deoxyribonuclease-4|nr:deoxyribonuclease IV [Clostridia bacterium]
MLKIGCHLSISKGFYEMGKEAVSINANTIQFFTRNPRGGAAKEIDEEDVKKFKELAKQNKIENLLAHAPYTLNAAAAKPELRKFAKETMIDDLKRMEYFPGNMYNFHPGSHVGQGVEVGTEYIIEMLNEIIKPEQTTKVLLETMAGKGSEIGKDFEEIKNIMNKIKLKDHIGVCLDTCHIFDGGYDIVNELDKVVEEFDKIIGLDKLYAIHLNDSMNECNSHKDRHAKIGEGNIGLDALVKVINHPKLKHLPFFLETPNDLEGYGKEIKILRENYNN